MSTGYKALLDLAFLVSLGHNNWAWSSLFLVLQITSNCWSATRLFLVGPTVGTPNLLGLANQHIYWSYCSKEVQGVTKGGTRPLRDDGRAREQKVNAVLWVRACVKFSWKWLFRLHQIHTRIGCSEMLQERALPRRFWRRPRSLVRGRIVMNLGFLTCEMEMMMGICYENWTKWWIKAFTVVLGT